MPRTTHETYEEWLFRGRRVGYLRAGLYYIDRRLAGKRVRFSTGCVTREAADEEYQRFELNPAAFISRAGRRVLAARRGVASDPVRTAQLRDNHFARRYAITAADYARMLLEQGGRCAICGVAERDTKGAVFDVDHDHRTGATRGLLCGRCNRGIGSLGDSPELLERAAAYLRERAPSVPHPQPTPRIQEHPLDTGS